MNGQTDGRMDVSQTIISAAFYQLLILYNVKVKVKFSLCLTKYGTIKAYSGSGITAPRIL
jgi:hypothetical protein